MRFIILQAIQFWQLAIIVKLKIIVTFSFTLTPIQ